MTAKLREFVDDCEAGCKTDCNMAGTSLDS